MSVTVLVTARNAQFPPLKELAGPSLPVPTDPRQWRNSPPAALMSMFGTNRENALVCIVLHMFIAQHNEQLCKTNISDFKLLQLNTCPLKSLIAAAAHPLICWSLCVLTSSPFFFFLPWSSKFVASKLHSVKYCKANRILRWGFGFFFPFLLFPWLRLPVYLSKTLPSSFSPKLPLSAPSCTTPDSKNFDISFNEGGIKVQILFVSPGSSLWDVKCIFLSLMLECKRLHHAPHL